MGANVEAEASGDNDCRPLHTAAKNRQAESAKILITEGKANVHAPDRNKNLPLNLAAM